ncbi:MAG: acyltransferase family protein, partial [Succinivibrio sp.]
MDTVFALFFAYIMPAIQEKLGNPSELIDYILYFKGSDCPHLWYMYMILGLYLVIPVLRFLVKKENEIYVKWMIVACLLYHFTANSLNILTVGKELSLTAFLAKFHLESATGFTGYLLLGWYLSVYRLEGIKLLGLVILGALALVMGILAVQFLIDDYPMIRDFVYQEPSLPALIYGCAIFSAVVWLFKDKTYTTEHKILRICADFTFGMFIIHVFYIEILFKVLMPYKEGYNPLLRDRKVDHLNDRFVDHL